MKTSDMPALIDPTSGEGRARRPRRGSELPGHRPKAAMTFPEDHTGELDLADRHALRRVAGLSTEGTLAAAENSLRELSRLAETAGSVVLDGLVQRRGRPDPATYVGAGKAAELASLVTATGADTVICDNELTPGQLRRLEGVVKVKVIDRTALILDI